MLAVIPSIPSDALLATDTAIRSMPAKLWVGPFIWGFALSAWTSITSSSLLSPAIWDWVSFELPGAPTSKRR